MSNFISDEEMAKLEKPGFISDEEMTKSEQPSTASDLMGSITHNIPLAGVAQKAGSAFAAGAAQLTPDAVLKPEYQGKSFTELYKMNQDKVASDQAAREERSPIASTVGSIIGSAAPVPLAATLPAAATRVGLNVADQATRADTLSEAGDKALTSGAISAAGEALIPGASKLFKASAVRTAEKIVGGKAEFLGKDLVEELPWSFSKREGAGVIASKAQAALEKLKKELGEKTYNEAIASSMAGLKGVPGQELKRQAAKRAMAELEKDIENAAVKAAKEASKGERLGSGSNILLGLVSLAHTPVLPMLAAKVAHGTPAGAKLENMAGQALGSKAATALQTIAARKATQD